MHKHICISCPNEAMVGRATCFNCDHKTTTTLEKRAPAGTVPGFGTIPILNDRVEVGKMFDRMQTERQGVAAKPEGQTGRAGDRSMAEQYPKYYKPIPLGMKSIDVYAVCQLFPVQDDTGCINHARKKLLVPGVRTGGKSLRKDIEEARDSLNRWLQLNPETVEKKTA